MARSVRKVSRQSTKNQKREINLNKKWIIAIVSSLLVIVIGLSVGLGIYFGTKKTDSTYVSDKVYFVDPILNSQNEEVSGFNKENYQALNRYISDEYGEIMEHRFIFVYDGATFYADQKDEDNYDENYTALLKRIADLQTAVNKAQSKGIDVELYIVDTHVDGGTNEGILSDSEYGSMGDIVAYPVFIYMHNNEFKEKFEENKKDTISINGEEYDRLRSAIEYSITYLNSLS